jgi:hypothetical protein
MKVIDPGHRYQLDTLDGQVDVQLVFVKREGEKFPGNMGAHHGTTTQEVLRALIDRMQYVDQQIPWRMNQDVIAMLRESIRILEFRANERSGLSLSGHDELFRADIEKAPVCPTCGHVTCKHSAIKK